MEMSSKFIFFDCVLNSHDQPVLYSIDITRRNLMISLLKKKASSFK